MGTLTVKCATGKVSDGYHTFDELYKHRMLLFCALANAHHTRSWKSRFHEDGTMFDGWFIAGMKLNDDRMITYHLENNYWNVLRVEELERSPEWDGHTSQDVLKRLALWLL